MLTPRPPIVAVMGHIDHGKSSLLDALRKTNVVGGEAGGITQHISAYVVTHVHEGVTKRITFLDTPGHEAFRATRAKGATAADIAILVVAADEGVKPQTLEALSAIKEAGVPFIIALTKMDKPNADIHKAQASLLEHELYVEGMGGDIPYAAISSKTGEGIPTLLELITLTAELNAISGDDTLPAEGIVIEASREAKTGNSATLIIKNGSLSTGTFVIAGTTYAPVRFIEDFAGNRIVSAPPSTPVKIVGFSGLPETGSLFKTVATKKEAERIVGEISNTIENNTDVSTEGKAILPLIVKTDVSGSKDAIIYELSKLQHEHIALKIISSGVGPVSEGDVKTAVASHGGCIVAFNTGIERGVFELADRSGVSIQTFSIIYELKEYVEKLLKEKAPRVTVEKILGKAKVLRTFSIMGSKQVIGARVTEGVFSLKEQVKLDRRGVPLGKGKILNLQTQKIDKDSVSLDMEFGAQIDIKAEIAVGDELIAFTITES